MPDITPDILFVEMPFRTLELPNLALGQFKPILENAGFSCDIRYANFEFAQAIGYDVYARIAGSLPPEFLIGELVFAPQIGSRADLFRELIGRTGFREYIRQTVPDWIWENFPHLQQEAKKFIHHTAKEIIQSHISIIGFSVSFQAAPCLALCKALKELAPDMKTIIGGALCEGDMGSALHENYPWIDFVCKGEGENLLIEFIRSIKDGTPQLADIEGLIWRENGNSSCKGEYAEPVASLDSLPAPDYSDWIERISLTDIGNLNDNIAIPLEFSRGCQHGQSKQCIFCGISRERITFRQVTSETAISHLNHIKQYGLTNVFLHDRMFPPKFFDDLVPRLGKSDLGMRLFAEVRADLTKEQLRLLKKANISQIQPGIESLSTPILQLMRKGTKAYQNIRFLKWCAELQLTTSWHYLYGFPNENPDEYAKSAELIPLISHLMPPFDGCSRVRYDRYSPMHNDYKKFGVKRLSPVHAYSLVYDTLPPHEIERIAYYFEDDNRFTGQPDYVKPLSAAIRKWHQSVGQSSLCGIVVGDVLHIFDQRDDKHSADYYFTDSARTVYLACDGGATIKELVENTGEAVEIIRSLVDSFCKKGLAIEIDGKILSLTVMLNPKIVKEKCDVSSIGFLFSGIYCRQMSMMWGQNTSSSPNTESADCRKY